MRTPHTLLEAIINGAGPDITPSQAAGIADHVIDFINNKFAASMLMADELPNHEEAIVLLKKLHTKLVRV